MPRKKLILKSCPNQFGTLIKPKKTTLTKYFFCIADLQKVTKILEYLLELLVKTRSEVFDYRILS